MSTSSRLIHNYPGRDAIIRDACTAMTSPHCEKILTWAAREMRSASPLEIAAFVDAAGEAIISADAQGDRDGAIRSLDILRTSVSQFTALHEVQTQDSSNEIIDSLLAVIRVSDAPLTDHLNGVGALAGRLARVMNLDAQCICNCIRTGRLHDIGKMALPRSLFEKSFLLSEEEETLFRSHVALSVNMLLAIPALSAYVPFVRAHRERLDGSGYPDALLSHSIPLESRIVAVADVLHEMISHTPSHPALAPREAITVISDSAGLLFDIDVVNALRTLFGHGSQRAVAAA